MTAKEAISILEFHNPFLGTDKKLTEAFDMSIKALTAQQWIPCSERLPDEGIEVLCCFRNGDNYAIIVSKRTDFNLWSSVGRTSDSIAWMPLPEPWKGEQE